MLYKIQTITTNGLKVPVIQGHDGSKVTAFKDFRDNLLLDLEKRIYNNLKVEYDLKLFDIHDLAKGLYRSKGLKKMIQIISNDFEFSIWLRLVDLEYTKHDYFPRNNEFTFNYPKVDIMTQSFVPAGGENYIGTSSDTDLPYLPWEMLDLL